LLIFAVGFSLPAVRLPGATPPFWHTKEGGRGWEGVREGVGKGFGKRDFMDAKKARGIFEMAVTGNCFYAVLLARVEMGWDFPKWWGHSSFGAWKTAETRNCGSCCSRSKSVFVSVSVSVSELVSECIYCSTQ